MSPCWTPRHFLQQVPTLPEKYVSNSNQDVTSQVLLYSGTPERLAAAAVNVGLVFYPESLTIQPRECKRARESVLARCRGLSPLAAKPCEAVPWPFVEIIYFRVLTSIRI
jgi:hypothetical protein